jgi:hypothetical protein
VGPSNRGKKIGELFLKAAFRYATINQLEHLFIHGSPDKQEILFELLADFGFVETGVYRDDVVYVKKHPRVPPDDNCETFEYCRRYFPHFRHDASVRKFIVPIQPEFHRILFSDYQSQFDSQMTLFNSYHSVSNAIKQAYLCHSNVQVIKPGDIVLFYRSIDEQAITSLGIVEQFESLQDALEIVKRVRRRTVYNMQQIAEMATRPTKVMLIRLVRHFSNPPSFDWLTQNLGLHGTFQTIREIDDDTYQRIICHAA